VKNGLSLASVHPNRDWIFVDATVAQVEKLFECELATFVNNRFGLTRVAAVGGYSIPAEVSDIVKFVAGMTTFSFGRWTPIELKDGVATSAYGAVTPDTIYTNYKVPKTGSHGSKLGSQAVIEVGNLANFNDADLQTFFSQYQTSLKGEVVGMACTEKDGCTANNGATIKPSVEANLDVQYMMAAGPFVNTTDYKLTGTGSIEDIFLDYTIMVNGQTNPPLVHSISYGEYGGSYDNATDQQFSYELQKMGIAGVSVLLASGDNGVGCDSKGTTQEFDYPSSPYITMVGATQIEGTTKKETAPRSLPEVSPRISWSLTGRRLKSMLISPPTQRCLMRISIVKVVLTLISLLTDRMCKSSPQERSRVSPVLLVPLRSSEESLLY